MTIQELINRLEQVEDKTKVVKEGNTGEVITNIFEFDTCIYI